MKNRQHKLSWPTYQCVESHKFQIMLSAIFVLFLIQMIMRFSSVIGHDNSWYIYVAEGMLHHKTLYKDFLEPNPPLGIWLTIPLVWVANIFNFKAQTAVFSFFFIVTAGCLILCNKYLSFILKSASSLRYLLIFILSAVLLFIPGFSFGQREHLLVLFFLPWLLLRVAHYEGCPSTKLNWLVGAMAGLGFCLKPHYLLAPILVELCISVQTRSLKNLFDRENLAAGITLLIYPLTIWIFSPQFFEFLPLIRTAYPYYINKTFSEIYTPAIPYLFVVAYLLISLRYAAPLFSKLLLFILASAIGFLFGYFIQAKGFPYHLIPFLVMIAFGCGVVLCDLGGKLWISVTQASLTDMVILIVSFLLIGSYFVIPFFSLSPQLYAYNDRFITKNIERFSSQAKSIYIASANYLGFPYIVKKHKIWASRSPCEWLIPYVAAQMKENPSVEAPFVAQIREGMVSDLLEMKPDLIMINISTTQRYVPGGYFDYLKFWSSDPRFESVWKDYMFKAKDGDFAVYTKKADHSDS